MPTCWIRISNGTQNRNRRMPNGTFGGVRGQKMKVGRKLSFSSYSITFAMRLWAGADYGKKYNIKNKM